jgi:myo-inositol 2-dehydrogenase / D-chiro-inositol 1-dehydrogenase
LTGSGAHIGLVGVGRMGVFHARTLLALDAVRTLTIADADSSRARMVADQLGASVAESAEALVEAVDAVVIATATAGHVPLLKLAARAGIPAFCEKPVALDLRTLDDVIDETARAGIRVQIGFQRRFDEGFLAAREAITQGTIGTLLLLRLATHDHTPPPEAFIASSGGIFRDLHSHDFDSVRFVTGQEVVEVYADGAVRETPWFARHGDVDTAVAILRLSDGPLVILSGTRHDPRGHDVRLEAFGTADSIAVGLDRRTPLRSVEPGVSPPAEPEYANFLERFGDAFRRELAGFVDGDPGGGGLEDARAALLVALAAGRSRAEHRPVSIGEIAAAG